MISNPMTIANKFNEYFAHIGSTLADKISAAPHFNNYLNNPVETKFSFQTITENKVSNIINDLPTVRNIFDILMYADDTTLFCNFDNIRNENTINNEINKVYDWLCSNKLSLNVSKTKYMCFHTSNKTMTYPKLKINNVTVDKVNDFKFLGLIISSNLKWNKHINHISIKVSKVIGIMFRLRTILPSDVLQTLYNSLIMPHFHYCLLIWGSTVKTGYKFHLLQMKAFRLIDNSHITLLIPSPSLKKILMVKIIDMFSFAVWKFYYKLMNDHLLPPYFNYMKPNLPVICNHYNVRNPQFHLPAIKHDFAKQLIQHCLIKLLNKDENISEIANKVFDQTFCMFKSTLKNKVITSYCVSCKRMALDVHGLVGVDVVDGVDWGGCYRWSVISKI